ncbi:MAG: hypothetical protein QM733_09745 [Ilumatobacteraceae bacterium]
MGTAIAAASPRRPRDRAVEVGTLEAAEVLREGAVLQVVDRQHVRLPGARRGGAATVVAQRRVVDAASQPGRLGGDAPSPAVTVDRRLVDLAHVGQVLVGGDEPLGGVQHRPPRRSAVTGQPEQLAHEVLLGPADVARYAPQQVHRHLDAHHHLEGDGLVAP